MDTDQNPGFEESQFVQFTQSVFNTVSRDRIASYIESSSGPSSPISCIQDDIRRIIEMCEECDLSSGSSTLPQLSIVHGLPELVITGCTVDERSDAERETESTANDWKKQFKPSTKRLSNNEFDPLDFSAGVRLTPVKLSNGVFQILSSEPGIHGKTLKWKYTFIYHGTYSHEWSLLRAQHNTERGPTTERPIAVMNTWCKHIKSNECKIIDLVNPLNAKTFEMAHFWDSFSHNGTHVGFQLDEDYQYEWRHEWRREWDHETGGLGGPVEKDNLYLWRIDLIDNSTMLVARITAQTLFLNPLDDSPMWCLELAKDSGINEHLVLVSAFYLKVSHIKHHAYFAPKNVYLKPPTHIKKLSFQGDKRVYRNEDKQWEDYPNITPKTEDELNAEPGEPRNVLPLTIRTFPTTDLEQYKLNPTVIHALEREMRAGIDVLKATLSL